MRFTPSSPQETFVPCIDCDEISLSQQIKDTYHKLFSELPPDFAEELNEFFEFDPKDTQTYELKILMSVMSIIVGLFL